MPFVTQRSRLILALAMLPWLAYIAPAGAQLVSNAAGGPDPRTERRQVRPGCAAMVAPGAVTSDRTYIGGQCPGGLLDGIVITRIGSRGYVDTYKNGKSVGNGLWIGKNASGNHFFMVAIRDENGTNYGAASCDGANAGERANRSGLCQEAARTFGPEILDESSAVMAQVVGNPGVAPVSGSAAGDEARVLGGSFRP